jgi:hypothetical protein
VKSINYEVIRYVTVCAGDMVHIYNIVVVIVAIVVTAYLYIYLWFIQRGCPEHRLVMKYGARNAEQGGCGLI